MPYKETSLNYTSTTANASSPSILLRLAVGTPQLQVQTLVGYSPRKNPDLASPTIPTPQNGAQAKNDSSLLCQVSSCDKSNGI